MKVWIFNQSNGAKAYFARDIRIGERWFSNQFDIWISFSFYLYVFLVKILKTYA